jgi:Tol biopolymer transport system component
VSHQIYIVDLKDGSEPKELSSGKQGNTYAPTFSYAGDKVAWLELAEDGYDADRFVCLDLFCTAFFISRYQR